MPLLTGEKSNTTAAVIIANQTRMYSRLTDERVTAVCSVRDRGIFLCRSWSTNHERLVVDLLVTHGMGV